MFISAMRKGIKSPLSKILLLIIFVALFGGYGFIRVFQSLIGDSFSGWAAKINKITITDKALKLRTVIEQQRIDEMRMQYGQYADMIMEMMHIPNNPKTMAIDSLIQESLITQYANTVGFKITRSYLEFKLRDPQFALQQMREAVPAEMIANLSKFSNQKALRKLLLDTPVVREKIEKQVIEQLVSAIVQSWLYIPKFISENAYNETYSAKKFSIITFSLDTFIKQAKENPSSGKEVQAFFDEQTKRGAYWIPEKRSGIQWLFSPKTYGIIVSDIDILNYYEKHKNTKFVKDPAQVVVREIIFDDVKNNGLINLKTQANEKHKALLADAGLFEKEGKIVASFKKGDQADKAYERAAFKLKADNDISDVIELGNNKGYVILQRVSRKDVTCKLLDEVKQEIIDSLMFAQFKKTFALQAQELVRNPHTTKEQFDAFIKEHHGVESIIEPIDKSDSVISQKLYALKKEGDRTVLIKDSDGLIIQLRNIIKKNLPPFIILQSTVEKDFYTIKAQELLKESMNKAQNEIAMSEQPVTLISNAVITHTDWLVSTDKDKLDQLAKAGIQHDFMNLEKIGAVASSMSNDKGFILRLDEIRLPQNNDAVADHKIVSEKLVGKYEQYLATSFIASLYRNATIKINESLFNT